MRLFSDRSRRSQRNRFRRVACRWWWRTLVTVTPLFTVTLPVIFYAISATTGTVGAAASRARLAARPANGWNDTIKVGRHAATASITMRSARQATACCTPRAIGRESAAR